jgi:hypothetical protein
MPYLDGEYKITVVVDRTIGAARLMNAVSHCVGGLFAAGLEKDQAAILDYDCPAGEWTAKISRRPIVVLEAKNGGQLARFAREVLQSGLVCNFFTAAMLGDSAAQQQAQTRADKNLEYWCVAAYGEAAELREISKRYSLYKGAAEEKK